MSTYAQLRKPTSATGAGTTNLASRALVSGKSCEPSWLIGISHRGSIDIRPQNSKNLTRNARIEVCNSYSYPAVVDFHPTQYFLMPMLYVQSGTCDNTQVMKPQRVPATNFHVHILTGNLSYNLTGFKICQ